MIYCKVICLLTLLLFSSSSWAVQAIEFTFAGNYRSYKAEEGSEDIDAELGAGARLRWTSFKGGGTGYYLRAHIDEHILAPVLIPAIATRTSGRFYWEIGVGANLGFLVGRSATIAIMPGFGYKFSGRFFLSVPFYWDLNMGSPFLTEATPFIGYTF